MNFWDFLRFFRIFGFLTNVEIFYILGGLWILWIFLLLIFLDFLDFFVCFFWIFWIFLDFWIFWNFWFFFGFFGFFWFVGIPFKVTNVTTKSYQGYYWTPKIAKNGPKQHNNLFFARKGKKKRRPKASTGARSRPA